MPKSHTDQILVRIGNFPLSFYIFTAFRIGGKITNPSSLLPLKTLNCDPSSSMDPRGSCGPKRKAEDVDPATCKLGLQERLNGKKQKPQGSNLGAENNESGEDKGDEPMMGEQEIESEVPGTEMETKEEEGEEAEEFCCEICDMWCNSRIMMNVHLRGKKHKAKERKKREVGGGPRERRELWCEVCRLRCNSEVVMGNHLRGKKHKAKEGAFRLDHAKEEEEGERKIVEERGTEEALIAPMKGKGNAENGLWCEICDVRCNSRVVMERHLRGKKHKAKEGVVRTEHEKEEEVCNDHDDGNDPRENVSNERALMVTEGSGNAKNGLPRDIHEAKCHDEVAMENHLKGEKLKRNEGSRADNEREQEEKEERIIEEVSNEKAMVVRESNGIKKNRLWCEICDVRCNSEVVMAAHRKGKKHRTKEAKIARKKTKGQGEEMKEEERTDSEMHNAKNEDGEGGNCRAVVEANKNTDNANLNDKQPEELWCLICKVKCDGRAMMTAHLKCVEHKEREAQRWGRAVIGATEDEEAEEE